MDCMDSVEVRKISKITTISLIHCYNTQSDMFFFRFRFRFFIHQVLQQGKCLESGKYTNISKQQHRHTSVACL